MNFPPLLSSLADVFEVLLQGSLRGTFMAGGVLALQAALGARLSPRWRYGLWLAVAAALLLPPITRPAIDVTPLRDVPVVRFVITPDAAETHVPDAVPAVGSTAVKAPLTWIEIAATTWLSGVLAIAASWLLAHSLMMRRFRRDAFTLDAELLREIEQCAAAIGLRRIPDVLHAPAIPSPAVTGFLRGTLLLPADVQSRFTPTERRYMLLHELAHLRRGDLISNWLINALLALHWFNPALWLAAARVRADRESACDATVLFHTGADERSAYGHTLLKLHSEMQGAHGHPAFVGILERSGSIRQRIQHIASYGSGGKRWGTVAVIATAALLSCIGVRLYAQAPTASPTSAQPAPKGQIATLEKRLLNRVLNAHQVELESKVFTIDPSVGKISVGALTLTPPPEREDLPVGPTVGLMQQDELDQLIEKLSSLQGVQSLSTPRVTARHAQRAVLEIMKELRYASKWNVKGGGAAPEPTAFETKSVGLTIETETGVALQAKGERTVLDLNVTPQLVYFGGWKDAELAVEGTVEKPVFIENRKITTSLSIYDGQHVLLWWYMDLPDGVPWNYDPNLKAADLKTKRRTVLWVLSPRVLEARAHVEPGALPAEYFQPRNWETKDASVEHLLAHFKEQSQAIDPQKRGLNLVLAKPAKEPAFISLDLKDVSLIGALEHAFKAAGMRVEEQGDNTLVITEEPR